MSVCLCCVQSGPQAASELRNDGFDGLIVGVTGCAMDDDVDAYVQAGADLGVIKPLSITLLTNLVTHVQEHGYGSRPGFKLIRVGSRFSWISRR